MTTGSLLLDGEVRGIFDNHNKINWDNDVVWRKSGKHIYRTLIMFTTEWMNVFYVSHLLTDSVSNTYSKS